MNINETTKEEIIKIQKMLLEGVNYFREDISFWESYFEHHREGGLRTRESLSAGICNTILSTVNGSFYLQKNKIGSCWVTDCKNTSLHYNTCNKCKYLLRGYDFKTKLYDLDNNSVCAAGLHFSSIFDKPLVTEEGELTAF